jgi:predicted alpha/beta hydrolase
MTTHTSTDRLPAHHPLHAPPPRPAAGDSDDAHDADDPGDIHLMAADGRPLAATWFQPAGPLRAVTVVSSAAGVPRGYYRAFAGWLAQHGHAVLTYDYRGVGASRLGPLPQDPATMRDWALLDMPAALAAAEARRQAHGVPLLLVGHSFGGNSIAFAAGVERADALLIVAAGLGEPRLYPGVHRLVAGTFFRAWLPAVVRLAGHLPGWALGGGAQPLPPGVARQWRDWGLTRGWAYRHPDLQPHDRTARVRAPVHVWNVSDDLSFSPPGTVEALAARFQADVVRRFTVKPAELGLRRLGHFGAFRRQAGPALWARWMAPLQQAVPALPGHFG